MWNKDSESDYSLAQEIRLVIYVIVCLWKMHHENMPI